MKKKKKLVNLPSQTLKGFSFAEAVLFLTPIVLVLWVWLSPLAFIPVPWPDDSAFYFVAKELFHWPPRWVMLPQAPFEPTYRIFNFNTMPLFPILIGLGKLIGIDGTFLLKLWPLGAWALTGSLISVVLFRNGLSFFLSLMIALVFSLDPIHRWASVLVRPESLIGLLGVAILLGIAFGFPKRLQEKKLWHPISALLAIGAYTHFNAVHLVFPVIIAYLLQPKKVAKIGLLTALYLSPWFLTVLFHLDLFTHQMTTQWNRLAVPNAWLNSLGDAARGLFQSLGSPEPWPEEVFYVGYAMWFLVLLGILYLGLQTVRLYTSATHSTNSPAIQDTKKTSFSLLPAFAWILSSIWLFYTKPEVWFIYYVHLSIWTFAGFAMLCISKNPLRKYLDLGLMAGFIGILGISILIFQYVDISQANRMRSASSWNWATYDDFVSCVDQELSQLEKDLGPNKPFHVWCPTFPDITIELSRKHPSWELTRTNDFMDRIPLAIQHGWDTEAVVVTETLNWPERRISGKPQDFPEVQSAWMNWKEYFLNQFWVAPGWKPNRYLCQRGRWQAFIFMKEVPKK